jgi:toxin CcdB
MAQFDIYENQNPRTNKFIPYLLDVQTELLDDLQTRVVVPISVTNNQKPITGLMPLLDINGSSYLMLTPQLAGIHKKELGNAITNLANARQDILNALDFLITGV